MKRSAKQSKRCQRRWKFCQQSTTEVASERPVLGGFDIGTEPLNIVCKTPKIRSMAAECAAYMAWLRAGVGDRSGVLCRSMASSLTDVSSYVAVLHANAAAKRCQSLHHTASLRPHSYMRMTIQRTALFASIAQSPILFMRATSMSARSTCLHVRRRLIEVAVEDF